MCFALRFYEALLGNIWISYDWFSDKKLKFSSGSNSEAIQQNAETHCGLMSQQTLCKNQFFFKSVGVTFFLCWFDMEWPLSKMPVPWRRVYSYYCSWVVYHLNCLHHWSGFVFFQYLIKSRFENSERFSGLVLASWHTQEVVYVHLDWFVYKIYI